MTYVVDPEGIIRFASANDLSVGRNIDEVLRVLDALPDRPALARIAPPARPD